MPDKYELFLDKNKKVKLSADEDGNFFAEANGNRIKLGDDGLQKFGDGGVLEDVGGGIDEATVNNLITSKGYTTASAVNSTVTHNISAAVGNTRTFGFSQKNIPVLQLVDNTLYNLNFRNISSFTSAIDQAFNYASQYQTNLGQRFLMEIEYELVLDFGWKNYLYNDPDNRYYPNFREIKNWSSVTADSLELLGKFGSVSRARYNKTQNAGLPIKSGMSDGTTDISDLFFKYGGKDTTDQYGSFYTNDSSPLYGVPDDNELVPAFEIMKKNFSQNYGVDISSEVGGLSVLSRVYEGLARSYNFQELAQNLLNCYGTPVSEILNRGYVSGNYGTTWYRSLIDYGKTRFSGVIKVTLI